MPDRSRSKRRGGAQQKAPRPAATPGKTTRPVGSTASVTNRLPVVPWLTAGAIVTAAGMIGVGYGIWSALE